MDIQIECPNCSQRYGVGNDASGKQVRCKACRTTFRIPELAPAPEEAPVPMAELVLEPEQPPTPAVPTRPMATTRPLVQPAPAPDVYVAPRRKPQKPARKKRRSALGEAALVLLLLPFIGSLLHPGRPIGPYTWAFEVITSGLGLTFWLVVMVRRGSQWGMWSAAAMLVVAMGMFTFEAVVLGIHRSPNAEQTQEEEDPGSLVADSLRDELDRDERPEIRLPVPRPRRNASAQAADRSRGTGVGDARLGEETELLGGSGGGPFRSVSSSGQPVVGFSYSIGSWSGEPALSRLEPLYDRTSTRGFLGPESAREDYALGALEVDAAKYVNAIRPVFMRIGPDGRLDSTDSYKGEWAGTPTGRPVRTLDGHGAKVIGIVGRRAAVLDAVGLVLEKSP